MGRGLKSLTTVLAFCAICLCEIGLAIPVPRLDIDALSKTSDLIVVGKVGRFTKIDTRQWTIGSKAYAADVMEGAISVSALIKGAAATNDVKFRVLVMDLPSGSVGMDGIPEETYRIVFLRKDQGQYLVTDSYHPSLPATPNIRPLGQSAAERVVSVECEVIESNSNPPGERLEAMRNVRRLADACIKPALKEAATQQVPEVRLTAEAELLVRNDTSTLGAVLPDVVGPEGSIPSYLRHNILYAIRTGLKEPSAVPFVGLLLKNGGEEARASAVDALKNIGSPECLPLLVSALSDSNQGVRYAAVTALADINGVPTMHPSIPAFQEDEGRYLSYWQGWAKSREQRPDK